jgi:hypothetical protein
MYAVVLLSDPPKVYGPFRDPLTAERFAEFLATEVDPAVKVPLTDPAIELLNWRDHIHAKGTEAVDRMVADAKSIPADASVTPLSAVSRLNSKRPHPPRGSAS